jgi:hypothetical protein
MTCWHMVMTRDCWSLITLVNLIIVRHLKRARQLMDKSDLSLAEFGMPYGKQLLIVQSFLPYSIIEYTRKKPTYVK